MVLLGAEYIVAAVSDAILVVMCITLLAVLIKIKIRINLNYIIFITTIILMFLCAVISLPLDLCATTEDMAGIASCVVTSTVLGDESTMWCPKRFINRGYVPPVDYIIYIFLFTVFVNFMVILRLYKVRALRKKQEQIIIAIAVLYALLHMFFLVRSSMGGFVGADNRCTALKAYDITQIILASIPAFCLVAIEIKAVLQHIRLQKYHVDDVTAPDESTNLVLESYHSDLYLNGVVGYDIETNTFKYDYIIPERSMRCHNGCNYFYVGFPLISSILLLVFRVLMGVHAYRLIEDPQFGYFYNALAIVTLLGYPLVVSVTPLKMKPEHFAQVIDSQWFQNFVNYNSNTYYLSLLKQLILYRFYCLEQNSYYYTAASREIMRLVKDLNMQAFEVKYTELLGQNKLGQGDLFDDLYRHIVQKITDIFRQYNAGQSLQYRRHFSELQGYRFSDSLINILRKSKLSDRNKSVVNVSFLL